MFVSNKTDRYDIVFFTGAGISKESGIPTFDEMDGIRDKLTREYATKYPEQYKKVIDEFVNMLSDKEPNNAHFSIADFDVDAPVITMNVDKLHQKAGSKNVIEVHGELPDKIVLYGDPAPAYKTAFDVVKKLKYGNSRLIVVGTSFYTGVSKDIMKYAKQRKAIVHVINEQASIQVPDLLSRIKKLL